ADAAVYFYRPVEPNDALKQQHYVADIKPALEALQSRLGNIEWNRAKINEVVKSVVTEYKLKMPKLAMPLRVMVTGDAQSPSIDATLELIGREQVLARM